MLQKSNFFVYPNIATKDAAFIIQNAISKRSSLLVIGNCSVNYEGRASSKLDWGERIVLIKSDKSVLVHRSEGYEPVNWQPPGCIIQTELMANTDMRIRVVRSHPREVLEIVFDELSLVIILNLVDRGAFSLYVSEDEIQEAVMIKPSLIEEGFRCVANEKAHPTGFIDIFGMDKDENPVIVEIKRVTVNKEAVLQLRRYMEPLARTNPRIRGIIVAPKLGKGLKPLLDSMNIEFMRISIKKCAEVLKKTKGSKISDFFSREREIDHH
jgi:endonuclease